MRPDDRYSWLDEEAAERLLRGRSADGPPATDPPGLTALTRALDELAAVRATAAATAGRTAAPGARDDGELPGEAAALAAFRAARTRTPAQALAGRGRWRYPGSFGRPLRVGIATAALGGVLGGVAVAAGTGVLPAPFGRGNDSPGPASTVSAAPGDPPGHPSGGTDAPSGEHGPGSGAAGDARGGSAGSGSPGDGDPADAGSGDRRADGGVPGAGGDDSPDPADRPSASASDVRVAELCDEREAGGLTRAERAELTRAAGGPDEVDGLCRRYGGTSAGTGGGTSGGTSGRGSPGGDPPGGSSIGGATTPPTGPVAPSTGGAGGGEGGDALPDGESGGGDALPAEGGDGTSPRSDIRRTGSRGASAGGGEDASSAPAGATVPAG